MVSAKYNGSSIEEKLYREVGQREIFEKFIFDEVSFSKKYKSPFRKDNRPGCAFYINDFGRLLFHDFAMHKKYTALQAVQAKLNLTKEQAIQRIYEDVNKIYQVELEPPKKPVISKIDKPVESLAYWSDFHINKKTLLKYNVTEVTSIYFNGTLKYRGTSTNPIFAYNFPSGRFKWYRPKTNVKWKKWGGTATQWDVQGIEQLPDSGDILFITSSLKDVMVLYELGY